MLTGRNCTLKILEEADWRTAYDVFAQPHVWPWIVADPARVIPSEFVAILMGRSRPENCRLFGIWTDRMIGFCGLRDIDWQSRTATMTAYAANEPHKGFPRIIVEAVRLMLDHGFRDMGLNRIDAEVLSNNKPVVAVLSRIGLKIDGVLRQKVWSNGAFHDVAICAMLRSEHLAQMETQRHVRLQRDCMDAAVAVEQAAQTS